MRDRFSAILAAGLHALAAVVFAPFVIGEALPALVAFAAIALHYAAVLAIGRWMVALSLLPVGVALFGWTALIVQGGLECGDGCDAGKPFWWVAMASLAGMALVVLAAPIVVARRRAR